MVDSRKQPVGTPVYKIGGADQSPWLEKLPPPTTPEPSLLPERITAGRPTDPHLLMAKTIAAEFRRDRWEAYVRTNPAIRSEGPTLEIAVVNLLRDKGEEVLNEIRTMLEAISK